MADQFYHITTPGAYVRVTGEDAPRFLQSQCSQDLSKLQPGSVTYGLWLNVKGKVIADSFILRESEESYLLLSYYVTAKTIMEKLDACIIADDVELENLTPNYSIISILGKEAPSLLSALKLPEPELGTAPVIEEQRVMRGRRTSETSYEILLSNDKLSSFKNRLIEISAISHAEQVDCNVLKRMRIAAGIPAIPEDIGSDDLPHEAGLDRDAVSVNKGCYLGQEVMNRLSVMGQARRELRIVQGEGPPPVAGTPVIAGDASAGNLRSTVTDNHNWIGLALLKKSALETDQPLKIQANNDHGLTVISLK